MGVCHSRRRERDQQAPGRLKRAVGEVCRKLRQRRWWQAQVRRIKSAPQEEQQLWAFVGRKLQKSKALFDHVERVKQNLRYKR